MENLRQAGLFEDNASLPNGLLYLTDFITHAQEEELVTALVRLPFREARFQGYVAKRRVVQFGVDREDDYDDERSSIRPLPPLLIALRQKVADWLAIDSAAFIHVLASEYRTGTPIGWHRDKPPYGIVVGLSLAGWGQMRFRPMSRATSLGQGFRIELAPRSVYVMRGPIRWEWQHSLSPTRMLRYSITFRTSAGSDGGLLGYDQRKSLRRLEECACLDPRRSSPSTRFGDAENTSQR